MTTRPDWFIAQIAGSELELTSDQKEVLGSMAENFLRSCGSIPFGEWMALGPESKAAFIAAGDRIRREQALETARMIAELLDGDSNDKA